MVLYPTFQAQNPSISGYKYGWISCMAFAGAMVASFDRQVKMAMTGGALRNRTGDFTGGLNLNQIDVALNEFWDIDLLVLTRLPYSSFLAKIDKGCAAVLSGSYRPVHGTKWDAGHGFTDNHAWAVMPNRVVMDPLADGRYPDVYRFKGEAYPSSLMESFAGALDLDPRSGYYKPLGKGLVYAAFSHDRLDAYHLHFTGGRFWVYRVDQHTGRIVAGSRGRYARAFAGPTGAPCGTPKKYMWEPDPENRPGYLVSKILVPVTAGALEGEFVAVPQGTVSLEVLA